MLTIIGIIGFVFLGFYFMRWIFAPVISTFKKLDLDLDKIENGDKKVEKDYNRVFTIIMAIISIACIFYLYNAIIN